MKCQISWTLLCLIFETEATNSFLTFLSPKGTFLVFTTFIMRNLRETAVQFFGTLLCSSLEKRNYVISCELCSPPPPPLFIVLLFSMLYHLWETHGMDDQLALVYTKRHTKNTHHTRSVHLWVTCIFSKPLQMKLMLTVFKNSVHISKKTQPITITRINQFLLFREIIVFTPKILW
jgi:hypothetical protein